MQRITGLPINDVILNEENTNFIYANRLPVFVGLTASASDFVEVSAALSKIRNSSSAF